MALSNERISWINVEVCLLSTFFLLSNALSALFIASLRLYITNLFITKYYKILRSFPTVVEFVELYRLRVSALDSDGSLNPIG